MFDLKDKVAIVTGAGQGIGKEIALTLARYGANMVIAEISEKRSEVAKEVESLGVKALAIKCDVSNKEEVENLVKETLEKFGKIDILVNNAGVAIYKPFAEMTEQDWDYVLNVNLKGVFYCTRAVLPKMMERKYGKIVNISSIAGSVMGPVNLVPYSASKAGIVGFTRSLALEVARHGINVNAIAPAVIETLMSQRRGKEGYEQMKKLIPMGRWGSPRDVANLVAFLVSDESTFITGQCIVIDGGCTLQDLINIVTIL